MRANYSLLLLPALMLTILPSCGCDASSRPDLVEPIGDYTWVSGQVELGLREGSRGGDEHDPEAYLRISGFEAAPDDLRLAATVGVVQEQTGIARWMIRYPARHLTSPPFAQDGRPAAIVAGYFSDYAIEAGADPRYPIRVFVDYEIWQGDPVAGGRLLRKDTLLSEPFDLRVE